MARPARCNSIAVAAAHAGAAGESILIYHGVKCAVDHLGGYIKRLN